MKLAATREVLLRRHGLVFLDDTAGGAPVADELVQAIGVKLAALGYVPSAQLTARLRRLPVTKLAEVETWMWTTLATARGGDVPHVPLFRSFPDDIPADTFALWVQKVLVHYVQGDGQPCLFCHGRGTTHVLKPCWHVVCDACWDGRSYSACPVCEQRVDPASPFFQPSEVLREATPEAVRFKLLDVAPSLDAAARALLLELCARAQAMSPDDVEALGTLVAELGERVVPWLPDEIRVRENVAHVVGGLLRGCPLPVALSVASRYVATATDVLRIIAVYSGADPALQGSAIHQTVGDGDDRRRWHGATAVRIAQNLDETGSDSVVVPLRVRRFPVARLSRPLRRGLLELLDGLPAQALTEDLLRHASYWRWVGELLHPGEYASRYPTVARAFAIVRGKDPAGVPAPAFQTWAARLAAAMKARDVPAFVALLRQRPGELGRRLDHALRLADDDARATALVLAAFDEHVAAMSTPVLLALRSGLPRRLERAPLRIYWPKGAQALGVPGPDTRRPLRSDVVASVGRRIDDELLRRFAALPAVDVALLDLALRDVPVPFNERTASRGEQVLPRGTRVALPPGKALRLFVHWCEPEGGDTTDVDLSIGFYDAAWAFVGVCSYYQLRCPADGTPFATSAGDLRGAPFPLGATELIDLDVAGARGAGARYAVMVVNSFAGLPFSQLARGFAGVMLRDDVRGLHFDPRTVEHRFDLAGERGVFLPLVVDLQTGVMHWLDVHARGLPALNNVATSNKAITTLCPNLIDYFASGVRPSMYELGALHAAARARRVYVRDGAATRVLERRDEEPAAELLARLLAADDARLATMPELAAPVLAVLHRNDLDLPAGSTTYALVRDRAAPLVAASSLIA